MLNQYVVVGRIKKIANNTITLGVSANHKNKEGKYDTYMIQVNFIGQNIYSNVKDYCHIGDIVGVKAHLEDNNKIIADKVTFLTSHSNK